MILKNKRFEDIQKDMPQDLYNMLINRKRRVVEEERKIRINQIRKLCEVNSDEEMKIIMEGIKPLLWNK